MGAAVVLQKRRQDNKSKKTEGYRRNGRKHFNDRFCILPDGKRKNIAQAYGRGNAHRYGNQGRTERHHQTAVDNGKRTEAAGVVGGIPVRAGEEFTESPELKKRNGITGDEVEDEKDNNGDKRADSKERSLPDCFGGLLQGTFTGAYDKCCCALAASGTLVSHEV